MTKFILERLTDQASTIFMLIGALFIFISAIRGFFQKQEGFEQYFKKSIFQKIGFSIVAIGSIILGINILLTGEFVYKGGHLATGMEAYIIGIFTILMFPVLFLSVFIERFFSKKNDKK